MGDIACQDRGERFCKEFERDIVARYRSKALDGAFGDKVEYYLGWDESNLENFVGVNIDGESFRLGNAPTFSALFYDEDLIEALMECLDISEDEAIARLEKAKLINERPS